MAKFFVRVGARVFPVSSQMPCKALPSRERLVTRLRKNITWGQTPICKSKLRTEASSGARPCKWIWRQAWMGPLLRSPPDKAGAAAVLGTTRASASSLLMWTSIVALVLGYGYSARLSCREHVEHAWLAVLHEVGLTMTSPDSRCPHVSLHAQKVHRGHPQALLCGVSPTLLQTFQAGAELCMENCSKPGNLAMLSSCDPWHGSDSIVAGGGGALWDGSQCGSSLPMAQVDRHCAESPEAMMWIGTRALCKWATRLQTSAMKPPGQAL